MHMPIVPGQCEINVEAASNNGSHLRKKTSKRIPKESRKNHGPLEIGRHRGRGRREKGFCLLSHTQTHAHTHKQQIRLNSIGYDQKERRKQKERSDLTHQR